MAHPHSRSTPILAVASALGMDVTGRKARCFNGKAHKSGIDETPALVFHPGVNRFKCYACGERGDVIDLVRGVLGVSISEAVQYLDTLTGGRPGHLPLPQTTGRSATPTAQAKRIYARLFELTYRLEEGTPGGKYLRGRGIDLAVADRSRVTEMRSPGETWGELTGEFEEGELRAAGLVSHRGKFLFGGHRLLFFHFDGEWPQFVMAR